MKNRAYWQRVAEGISPGEEHYNFVGLWNEVGFFALNLLEKGLALIFLGQEERGLRFLNRSFKYFSDKSQNYSETADFVALYFIDWVLRETPKASFLFDAVESKKIEITDDVFKLKIKDIFEHFKFAFSVELTATQEEESENFTILEGDHLPYLVMGNRFIEAARLHLLTSKYGSAGRIITSAGKFYLQMEKIAPPLLPKDYMVRIENPLDQIGNPKGVSPVFYLPQGLGYANYNVNLFKKQGEIISYLIYTFVHPHEPRDKMREILLDFHNRYINPPGKVATQVGLMTELEWVLIRKWFDYFKQLRIPGKSSLDILKEYLA